MKEYFLGNSLCLVLYMLVIVLLMFQAFIYKYKKTFLILALILYVFDITYLLILGFGLNRCAIVSGICVILLLLSIKVGHNT